MKHNLRMNTHELTSQAVLVICSFNMSSKLYVTHLGKVYLMPSMLEA